MCKKKKKTTSGKKDKKYAVASSLARLSIFCVVIMLTVIGVSTLLLVRTMIIWHMEDSLTMSTVQYKEILSKTITDLKTNDLMLTNSELWASAKTGSDIQSNPKVQGNPNIGNVKNGFQFVQEYKETEPERKELKKASWYNMPRRPPPRDEGPILREGIEMCAQSLPFMGEYLTDDHTSSFGTFNYIGFTDSGVMCAAPLMAHSYFTVQKMEDENYNCTRDMVPEYFDEWNEKWYSPLCRDWYIEQTQAPERNTMTDLYLYSSGSIGLTTCSPFSKYSSDPTSAPFLLGVQCIDVSPMGDLDDYFTFSEDDSAKYLIFDANQIFTVDAEDKDSEFFQFMQKNVIKPGYYIDDFHVVNTKARMYGNEMITWGQLFVNSEEEDEEGNPVEVLQYYFTGNEINIDLKKRDLNQAKLGTMDVNEARSANMESKVYEFTLFFNGSEALQKVADIILKLQTTVFKEFVVWFLIIFLLMAGVFIYQLNIVAFTTTVQIIYLLETLNAISEKRENRVRRGKDNATTILHFKETNNELNQLQLTFNKVAKTIDVARTAEKEGNAHMSLLNYSEAYSVFKEFQNYREMGVCLNNIGSICMAESNFMKAFHNFDGAYTLAIEQKNDDNEGDVVQNQKSLLALQDLLFIENSRNFMRGYSLYCHIKESYDLQDLLKYKTLGQKSGNQKTEDVVNQNPFADLANLRKSVSRSVVNSTAQAKDRSRSTNSLFFEQNMQMDRRRTRKENNTKTFADISKAREFFLSALQNMSRGGKEQGEFVFQDLMTMIALYAYELLIIELLLKGQDEQSNPDLKERQMRNKENGITESKRDFAELITGQFSSLQSIQREINTELTEKYEKVNYVNEKRKGIRMIPFSDLKQLKCYLKGFYFHSTEQINEALQFYTLSLTEGGESSSNKLRLQALENIELIIREQREKQERAIVKSKQQIRATKFLKRDGKALRQEFEAAVANLQRLRKKTMIYKYLSHHYIQRRSVVFIIDHNSFSKFYWDKAVQFIRDKFKGLHSTDYFGLVSIGEQLNDEEVQLEEKSANEHIKADFLRQLKYKAPDLTVFGQGKNRDELDKNKLDKALTKALDWQMNKVLDTTFTKNGHTYWGPHKWIVSLISSDHYSISNFMFENESRLKRAENLSISIMGMSSLPMQHNKNVSEYRELCEKTSEGTFLNVVDKEKCSDIMSHFGSQMDVYPSEKLPIITEQFTTV